MGPELTPSGQVSPLPSLPSLESVAAKADFAVDRNPEPNRDWRGLRIVAGWLQNLKGEETFVGFSLAPFSILLQVCWIPSVLWF